MKVIKTHLLVNAYNHVNVRLTNTSLEYMIVDSNTEPNLHLGTFDL